MWGEGSDEENANHPTPGTVGKERKYRQAHLLFSRFASGRFADTTFFFFFFLNKLKVFGDPDLASGSPCPSSVFLPLLGPPCSLRHNIDFRPVDNPTVASECSREGI